MATSAPKGFAALLQSAVHEPGILSQAYQQFHSYSLGNQLLAMFQCQERGIAPGPMATYPRWRELGRQVKKGEKALRLCMPITIKRKGSADAAEVDPDEPEIFTRFVYKPRWFVLAQTEGDALPEPEIPAWDREQALEGLDIREIPTQTATAWALPVSGRSRSTRSTPCRTRHGFTSWPMCCSGIPPRACRRTRRSRPAASGSVRRSRWRCCAVRPLIYPVSPSVAATSSTGGVRGTRSPSGQHSAS